MPFFLISAWFTILWKWRFTISRRRTTDRRPPRWRRIAVRGQICKDRLSHALISDNVWYAKNPTNPKMFSQVASNQGFSKVAKIVAVAAISNRALSSRVRTRLGNRGYIRDFGKALAQNVDA
jgi:hypothetical protein